MRKIYLFRNNDHKENGGGNQQQSQQQSSQGDAQQQQSNANNSNDQNKQSESKDNENLDQQKKVVEPETTAPQVQPSKQEIANSPNGPSGPLAAGTFDREMGPLGDGRTLGEILINPSFNPSKDGVVDNIKRASVALIDAIDSIDVSKAPSALQRKYMQTWKDDSIKSVVSAQMDAVKAQTANFEKR
jgi:hypothetical protein